MSEQANAQPATQKRTRYSDHQKASILAAAATAPSRHSASRQLGVPVTTLHDWQNGMGLHADVKANVEETKALLADVLEETAYKLVSAMVGKIDDATLQQVAVAMGITVDKMQILRNQPTQIVDVTSSERAERIARILAAAETRIEEQPALAAGAIDVEARDG